MPAVPLRNAASARIELGAATPRRIFGSSSSGAKWRTASSSVGAITPRIQRRISSEVRGSSHARRKMRLESARADSIDGQMRAAQSFSMSP